MKTLPRHWLLKTGTRSFYPSFLASVISIACLSSLTVLAACNRTLSSAALNGDFQTVHVLLDQGGQAVPASDKNQALALAATSGHAEVVRLLVDRGADVHWNEDNAVWKAAYNGHRDIVVFLVNHGADSGTALRAAISRNHLEIVQLLLAQGTDVNAKSKSSWTPLMTAALDNRIDILRLLLARDVDVNAQNEEGQTARAIAEKHGFAAFAQLLTKAEAATTKTKSTVLSQDSLGSITSDADILPTAKAMSKRMNAYAIAIGIENYREKLPKAEFASHDAKVFSEYLTKVLGYPEENVVVRLNDKASRADLEKYIENWLPNHVEKDSVVFFYFSGHGAPNPKTGDAYLVPYDGDPAYVDTTSYPLKRLYERLSKLPAKEVVVMLDACFSGAGERSVIASGARPMVLSVENPLLLSGNIVVLAASSGDQVSSTYKAKGHGLFTYFVLKGLQGEATPNKDGSLNISELFDYLKPQVERVARREFNNEQTPQLTGNPVVLKRGTKLLGAPPQQ